MENLETTSDQPGKVKKQFESTMRTLVAIVGGEKNLAPTKKIGTDTLAQVVEGLLKEEREEKEKQVKEQLKNLLSAHVQLQKEVKQKKEELAKLEEKKMKEFNESARQLFGQIDALGQREKEFYDSLNTATGSVNE